MPDVYNVDLDVEGGWAWSDIPLPGEIDARSIFRAKFTFTRYKCFDYLVEAPTVAALSSNWSCAAQILLGSNQSY